jgi:hypothetical protein
VLHKPDISCATDTTENVVLPKMLFSIEVTWSIIANQAARRLVTAGVPRPVVSQHRAALQLGDGRRVWPERSRAAKKNSIMKKVHSLPEILWANDFWDEVGRWRSITAKFVRIVTSAEDFSR